MRKHLFVFFVGLFFSWQISFANSYVFDFNDNCKAAYHAILQLNIEKGKSLLQNEKQLHPNNLIPIYLENYIDFFELFFNEDANLYQQKKQNREWRLNQLNKGSSKDPYFLFTKAVVNFQWATIRIKFGDNWDAGWELRRSFIQVKDNLQQFPDFAPAQLYYGSMLTALATIPDGYKWLGNLLGMKGDLEKGIQILETFVKRDQPLAKLYRNEAIFYYCYLQFHVLNKKEEVLNFIHQQSLNIEQNHLFNYLAANLYLNNQQAAKAEQVLLRRKWEEGYLISPIWNMQMGYVHLYQLKPETAAHFEKFIRDFKGKFYLKDVLIKLSWWYYLQGDSTKAKYYQQQVLEKGSTTTEADQQAEKYAAAKSFPPKDLLKARLLSDGGLNSEALKILQGKSASNYEGLLNQLEFNYRVARICDELKMIDKAKQFYQLVIQQGSKSSAYFAARSALQLGLLYEKEGNWSLAKTSFQSCINMKNHEYKNALDQRAKAGLERIKIKTK